MWSYHPELLATPVPRYTSYPTAAEFGPLPPDAYRTALEDARGDVSLYLHIPFCEQICFYCGCNTGVAARRNRLESYLAALESEIALVASLLPRTTRVRRISFGGGSPNALSPEEFLRLNDVLARQFSLADPILSTEIDPRTMTAEWAQAVGQLGITRTSLGVQTFAPHCQKAIGRVQPEEVIVRAVDWLRAAGVTSLNFDLMYGLPGQTRDDLADTMQRTRVLGADRVALFGYAHVPHVVPRQKAVDARAMPDVAERFAMAAQGYEYFCTHGYVPVGFDHFALAGSDPLAHAAMAGTVHRNFQGFTDDAAPVLIGLGASAISSFPHLLVQNEKNSGRYRMLLSQGMLAPERGIVRSPDDQERARVIERLLCAGHVHVPPALLAHATPRLAPFEERDLVSLDDGWLTVEAGGLPYARTIAALFDPWREQSQARFSTAV